MILSLFAKLFRKWWGPETPQDAKTGAGGVASRNDDAESATGCCWVSGGNWTPVWTLQIDLPDGMWENIPGQGWTLVKTEAQVEAEYQATVSIFNAPRTVTDDLMDAARRDVAANEAARRGEK